MAVEQILDVLDKLWPALPMALVGLGLWVGAWRARWQIQHSHEWVAVNGTVLQVWAQPDNGEGGTPRSWWVTARCDYDWAGQTYRNRPVSLTGRSVASQAAMERLQAEHPPGSRLALRLHPQRPDEPMAVAPEPAQVKVLAVIGTVFLALAAFFFFSASN